MRALSLRLAATSLLAVAAGASPALAAAETGGSFNPIDFSHGANLLWTVVIFLVALPFMWKIVWGPMTKALEARDHQAEHAVAAAEAAKVAAEQAKAEVEKRLAEAHREASTMISEARALGEAQGREAIASAQAQAQQTLERAKSEIDREKSKALAEIRETVVDLSVSAASKVVGRALTDDDQKRFVRDLVSGTTR